MKRILFALAIGGIAFSSCQHKTVEYTKNGVIVSIQSGPSKKIKLDVVDDDIIHVMASPDGFFNEEVNLIKDPDLHSSPLFEVSRMGDTVMLQTATTKAYLLANNGNIWFTDKDGKVLLKESSVNGKTYTPIEVDGKKGYSFRQVFAENKDEALYGLGQHQSDEFNYKGKNEELYQYNTKVSVPFVVSTKGYGLLWHNYSLSRFGDERPYADLNEVFTLYDNEGNPGSLTATYYADKSGKQIHLIRPEDRIGYEDLETIKDFPQGFPTNQATAVWEGFIEPKESGIHHFKMHYAGYSKVFINNEEVIPERWRTAWNPNDYKVKYAFEDGQKYPIRLEWEPDGDVSYMGLKVLSPVSEAEQNQMAFWSEMGDQIDYYFINGKTMDGVISGYRTLTGKSPVMPKWAMGYWLSRERYHNQDELLTALSEYRKRNVPLDVIVQDWSYWPVDAWGSHEFDSTRFPDPSAIVKEIHDKNARIMISVWPKFYMTTDHYKELDQIGAMYQQAIQDSIRDWIYPGYIGSFYDAYNPEARKIFWNQMNEHLYSLGIDAWWMDASEPNVQDNTAIEYRKKLCGPTYLGPSTQFFNAYALMNAEAIYDGQRSVNPDDRVFLLTRSGFAGQQRYSTATWSGDIGTRWEDMKAQITAGMNFAMSGVPYWTMDIGGFCVEKRYEKAKEGSEDMNEWRELNNRWYQFGAFCPLFRSHGQYPYREIYNIAPENTPTYQSMKYYTDLRYQLMPYIYTLAGKTYFDDYTIMRALVMDFTEDKNTYEVDDQFMFGPAFMACPVYQYKQRNREVYFPNELWYDFYTQKAIQGGRTMTVDAPYERMPLYVRAGSIIPTGNVIQSTAEPQQDLKIFVYAGKDGDFTLYEDNGTTYAYEQGNYSRVPMNYQNATKTLTIEKRQGSFPEMITDRNIEVVYITPENPEGISQKFEYAGEPVSIQLQ